MGLDPVSTEQITATARFRIDTRFNEYISHANPQMRPVLRELRDKVLNDLVWLTQRSAGANVPLERHFVHSAAQLEAKLD